MTVDRQAVPPAAKLRPNAGGPEPAGRPAAVAWTSVAEEMADIFDTARILTPQDVGRRGSLSPVLAFRAPVSGAGPRGVVATVCMVVGVLGIAGSISFALTRPDRAAAPQATVTAPAAAAATAVAPVEAAEPKPPAAQPPLDGAAKAAPTPRSPRGAATAPTSICDGGCDYRDVLDANDRVHEAYERAVEAGVPRSVLVSYRNRWARIQRRAALRPAESIRRYAAIERGLRREARE